MTRNVNKSCMVCMSMCCMGMACCGPKCHSVSEAVAETSDALMEKFFEGEPFTQDELIDGIHDGMNRGIITPVVCTSAADLSGIDMLLKEFELLLPSPAEVSKTEAVTASDDIIED